VYSKYGFRSHPDVKIALSFWKKKNLSKNIFKTDLFTLFSFFPQQKNTKVPMRI
jgi:hypothetical protein